MGIEENVKMILTVVDMLRGDIDIIKQQLKDLNEKVDLLTIRKQVNRQDKEKRIKDTLSNEAEKSFV
jgi:hypothetical protein